QIGLGRCAREGVYPQRYSTDWATKPQAHFSATRRAACPLGGGVVARSSQIHFGICSSLAPGLRPKSVAANVLRFRRHHTGNHSPPSVLRAFAMNDSLPIWQIHAQIVETLRS